MAMKCEKCQREIGHGIAVVPITTLSEEEAENEGGGWSDSHGNYYKQHNADITYYCSPSCLITSFGG